MKLTLVGALVLAASSNVASGQGQTPGWFVQIGSFESHTNALDVMNKVSGMELKASIQESTTRNRLWYVVRVGPYKTEGLATKDLDRVRRSGFVAAKIVSANVDAGTPFAATPSPDEYRRDFESASSEGTVGSYEAFAKRYCGSDPDGLVQVAVQKARTLRHASDRKIMLLQLPDMIDGCKTVEERLAHERKVGEASGFVDKHLMYELGQKKVYCDENLASWQKNFKLLKSGGDASAYLDQFVPNVCPSKPVGVSVSNPTASYDLRTDFGKLEEGVRAFFKLQQESGSEGVWETLQAGYAAIGKNPDPGQFQYLAAIDLTNYRWANNFKDSRPSLYASYPEEAKNMDLIRSRLVKLGAKFVSSQDEADEIVVTWLPKVSAEMDNYMRSKLGR